jgi:predicted dithiol-disulfide oxidoreductase (DUF899 family)
MNYSESKNRLEALRGRIADLRKEMRNLQQSIEPQPVSDYSLTDADGHKVSLAQLFGDKDTLFVIHNMGAGCSYCTLWADGFNGIYDHLNDRAAFVVTSPDTPDKQREFAQGRGWRFPLLSHAGTRFAQDMGYGEPGNWAPGISVFKRRGDQIVRVSDTKLGPGDDFCSVWHFFDMIPEGSAGWRPKYNYG